MEYNIAGIPSDDQRIETLINNHTVLRIGTTLTYLVELLLIGSFPVCG